MPEKRNIKVSDMANFKPQKRADRVVPEKRIVDVDTGNVYKKKPNIALNLGKKLREINNRFLNKRDHILGSTEIDVKTGFPPKDNE